MKKPSIFVWPTKTDFSNERNEWWHQIKKSFMSLYFCKTTMTFTYVFNFGKDVIIMWICFTPTICTKGSVRTVYPFLGSSRFVQIFSLIYSVFYPVIVIISVHYLQIFWGLYRHIYMNTDVICKFTFKLKLHLNDLVISQRFLTFLWNNFCVISVTHSTKHHLNSRLFFWYLPTIATLLTGITKLFDQLGNLDT